ncbi:hypothetical protein D3C73_838230 [compost metagenome]
MLRLRQRIASAFVGGNRPAAISFVGNLARWISLGIVARRTRNRPVRRIFRHGLDNAGLGVEG